MRRAILTAVCALGVSGACWAETISVGVANRTGGIGAAPLVVGVSGHHFADAGVDVELIDFPDDAAVEQAVAEGRADFGAARLDGAFFAYAAAHGLKIIAPEYSDETGYPAAALLVSDTAHDAGFHDARSIAHRRIGMTTPDGAAHYELVQVIRRYGIAPDAVELVWLGTEMEQLRALADGSVDAVAVPFTTAFERYRADKGATLIRLSDYAQAQQGVIFTRAETIRTKRTETDGFLRAYRAAVADYDLTFQQRDDDGGVLPGAHFRAYLTAMARQAGIAPTLLAYGLPYCDHLARLDLDDLDRQLRFWQRAGLVSADVTLSAVVDLSLSAQHIGGGQAPGKF